MYMVYLSLSLSISLSIHIFMYVEIYCHRHTSPSRSVCIDMNKSGRAFLFNWPASVCHRRTLPLSSVHGTCVDMPNADVGTCTLCRTSIQCVRVSYLCYVYQLTYMFYENVTRLHVVFVFV